MASPSVLPPSRVPPTSACVAWLAVCVIWGTTYLAIRIALESIPPGLLGGLRFTVAGLALAAAVRIRADRLPTAAEWPMQALIGVIMLGVGNGFVVVAEQWVPSGIAAVGVASAPFWMTGIEAAVGGDRLTGRMLAGFLIGFSGIVVLIWPDLFQGRASSSHYVLGIVLVQFACFGWSVGSSLSRRHTRHGNTMGASAVQQLAGGVAMLMVGSATGEWSALTFTARSLAAEIYLVIFGSLAAYSAYLYALQYLPVATVSLYAYINPMIAVLLGVVIASEPFSPRVAVAAAMVLAGIAVVKTTGVGGTSVRRAP